MFLGYTLNGFHKLKAAHKSAFSVWVNQKLWPDTLALPGLLLGLWALFLYISLRVYGLYVPVYSLAGTWANCIRRIVFHFKCCEISNVYGQRISKFLSVCVCISLCVCVVYTVQCVCVCVSEVMGVARLKLAAQVVPFCTYLQLKWLPSVQ